MNAVISCGSIVLAGGIGKRLGQRKENVKLGSKKLLHHVLDTAIQLSNEMSSSIETKMNHLVTLSIRISELSPRETLETISGL